MLDFDMLETVRNRVPDLPFFPILFPVFCSMYILAFGVVFRNWSPKHRTEASSCFISFVHGTPAAVLAACAIMAQKECGFASLNTNFQNLVLEFSISYFTVDLLHYVVFLPEDYLFIAHHVATLFVFVTCRYIALHGAYSLLVLLFLAEVTSFCQNVWTLAAMKRADSDLAAKVYIMLSPLFYAMYTVARVFVGPIFFFQMSSFYLRGKAGDAISWWISLSWIVVVGGAISVSILWVFNNWIELYRERLGAMEKKKT